MPVVRTTIAAAAALAGAALLALALLAGANAATVPVTVSNLAFSPATVNAAVGDTVTWTNQDAVQHTVSANNNTTFNGNLAGAGSTFSFTFTAAGTYAYHCNVHPEMTGSVVVAAAPGTGASPAAGGSPTATVQAPATGSGPSDGTSDYSLPLILAGVSLLAAGSTGAFVFARKR